VWIGHHPCFNGIEVFYERFLAFLCPRRIDKRKDGLFVARGSIVTDGTVNRTEPDHHSAQRFINDEDFSMPQAMLYHPPVKRGQLRAVIGIGKDKTRYPFVVHGAGEKSGCFIDPMWWQCYECHLLPSFACEVLSGTS
jgi:hypothetical protein